MPSLLLCINILCVSGMLFMPRLLFMLTLDWGQGVISIMVVMTTGVEKRVCIPGIIMRIVIRCDRRVKQTGIIIRGIIKVMKGIIIPIKYREIKGRPVTVPVITRPVVAMVPAVAGIVIITEMH